MLNFTVRSGITNQLHEQAKNRTFCYNTSILDFISTPTFTNAFLKLKTASVNIS